jgi:hypothetical protein
MEREVCSLWYSLGFATEKGSILSSRIISCRLVRLPRGSMQVCTAAHTRV